MPELNDYFLLKYLKDNLYDYDFISTNGRKVLSNDLLSKIKKPMPNPSSKPPIVGIPITEFNHDIRKLYGFSILNSIDDKVFIKIWNELLKSAITCLKEKDSREKYTRSKRLYGIQDYGLEELRKYLDKFKDFERLLYATNRYYRDHLYHVIKVWLLGSYFMNKYLRKEDGGYDIFLDSDNLFEGCNSSNQLSMSKAEFDSIWCIIALTHDLGYTLEQISGINPLIKEVLNFYGQINLQEFQYSLPIQNQFSYDYILKFISSRLDRSDECTNDKPFSTHLQSKYYIKYLNSFENLKHGIISCMLIMRHLVYFLESDFAYSAKIGGYFSLEDARQFQIRREILRSIASHTCDNIYHLRLNTLPFLLIICDEMQDWERPKYSGITRQNKEDVHIEYELFGKNIVNFTISKWIKGTLDIQKDWNDRIDKFKKLFRSALDSNKREFEFIIKLRYYPSYNEKKMMEGSFHFKKNKYKEKRPR